MEARASTAPILLAEMAAKACFLDTWISWRSTLKKSASQSELWMWGKHVTLEGLVLRCIESELMPILPCLTNSCKMGHSTKPIEFVQNGPRLLWRQCRTSLWGNPRLITFASSAELINSRLSGIDHVLSQTEELRESNDYGWPRHDLAFLHL